MQKNRLISELNVMEALSSVTGQHMEVVLHDLERPDASVLRIINGHVTGRQVGSSLLEGPKNDIGFTGLLGQESSPEETDPAVFTNYRTLQGRERKGHSVPVL